ncbi:hypothetical protein [Sebaldella sp. S0638]|uniref:hypothetical protein n=1 Tax=Sebaldella sp. S0638 TaxID=2957809 RepID=UPI0020A0715E|nr:hypothetical protein [Sebaldella sp. S0638]MCP1222792.1 hypothetical protein [Sebaldella sp. S0638]
MERITTILSLMLLEPLTDKLEFYDSNSSVEETLGLSLKQQMEIEKIYEKYLNEINELLKSDVPNDERTKIFDKLTMESKSKAEKLLTIKQLKMLSGNNLTA